MAESYDACPDCGNEEIAVWQEEVEYGNPTNLNSRGAEAPRYRTRTVTMAACDECGWVAN